MTEQEARERATELNRELGRRALGHSDAQFDADIPEDPGGGYFVAREMRTSPGEWEVMVERDEPGDADGFFRGLWRGFKALVEGFLTTP
jgi:hypothetical protein